MKESAAEIEFLAPLYVVDHGGNLVYCLLCFICLFVSFSFWHWRFEAEKRLWSAPKSYMVWLWLTFPTKQRSLIISNTCIHILWTNNTINVLAINGLEIFFFCTNRHACPIKKYGTNCGYRLINAGGSRIEENLVSEAATSILNTITIYSHKIDIHNCDDLSRYPYKFWNKSFAAKLYF